MFINSPNIAKLRQCLEEDKLNMLIKCDLMTCITTTTTTTMTKQWQGLVVRLILAQLQLTLH
jgi:hypothetical protein